MNAAAAAAQIILLHVAAAMACPPRKYRTLNELETFPFQIMFDITISYSISEL